MMKIEINSWYDAHVIFAGEFGSLKLAVEAAVSSGAHLDGCKQAPLIIAWTRILPDGDLVGWKKASGGEIIKLGIPASARRSHAFGRKCRAEFADVIEVIGGDGKNARTKTYGLGAIYTVGERVIADSWDDDFTHECSHGIHFFITRAEAEAWE